MGRPSKTKEYDDSVVWDLPYLAFMSAVFSVLRGNGTTRRVWSFDYAQLVACWRKVTTSLQHPNFVPYELRHAGPSWERLLNLRTLAEVQKRGRWKTLKSVMRYEKAGRLQQEMARMEPSLRHHLEECARLVVGCVRGAVAAPAPPRRR